MVIWPRAPSSPPPYPSPTYLTDTPLPFSTRDRKTHRKGRIRNWGTKSLNLYGNRRVLSGEERGWVGIKSARVTIIGFQLQRWAKPPTPRPSSRPSLMGILMCLWIRYVFLNWYFDPFCGMKWPIIQSSFKFALSTLFYPPPPAFSSIQPFWQPLFDLHFRPCVVVRQRRTLRCPKIFQHNLIGSYRPL